MTSPFQPARAAVKRLPRLWKYEWDTTTELKLTNPEHKLYVPNGHVQLISRERQIPMAEIFVDKIVIHEGMYFDGSTWAIDWGVMQRGAGYHDALCEAVDQGVIPESNQPIADLIMRDIWLSDAALVNRFLRPAYIADVHVRYKAVRLKQRLDHGA